MKPVVLLVILYIFYTPLVWSQEKSIIDIGQYTAVVITDEHNGRMRVWGDIGRRFDPSIHQNCKIAECMLRRESPSVFPLERSVWEFSVKVDEMTDSRHVELRRSASRYDERYGEYPMTVDISLFIRLSSDEYQMLCVAGHDYPGKSAMIRIDDNPPIENRYQKGCFPLTSDLEEQLRRGNRIMIRGYTWPYSEANTYSVNLSGYIAASTYLRNLIQ